MGRLLKLIALPLLVVIITGCGGGGTGGTTVSGTVSNGNDNTVPPPTTVEPIEPDTPIDAPQQVTSARGETPPLPVVVTGD